MREEAPCPCRSTHHEQREHGLGHIEAVAPVVVGDPPVPFAHGEQEPHQDLREGVRLESQSPPRTLPVLLHHWPALPSWV